VTGKRPSWSGVRSCSRPRPPILTRTGLSLSCMRSWASPKWRRSGLKKSTRATFRAKEGDDQHGSIPVQPAYPV